MYMKRGTALCARSGDENSVNSRTIVRIGLDEKTVIAISQQSPPRSGGSVEKVIAASTVLASEPDGGQETMLSVVRHRPFGGRATESLPRLDVEGVMNAAIDPRQSGLDDLRLELRRLAREVVSEYRGGRGRDARVPRRI